MTSFFKPRGAKLGQHLLTSRDIARAVCDAAHVTEGDLVLEVGPGKGMLTGELLEKGARVIAIEKDTTMGAALCDTFPDALSSGKLTLIEGDARDVLNDGSATRTAPYKVVANIPYYITGELIRLFLTATVQPETISLLVQKEVAERIARSKKESLLSLSVKVYGTPHYVKTVKAGSFNPPPSVDSAILAITGVSRERFASISEEAFFTLIHIGFAQKRKTLAGNLKRSRVYAEAAIESALERAGIKKGARAEDVSLDEWCTLTALLEA